MRRERLFGGVLFAMLSFSARASENGGAALWPEIEPYHADFLPVSDLHEIYYELCGNPAGTPVFVLHGGPGGSCSPYMRRFFDPAVFHVVLHDQRGAGRSKPPGEIRENTTRYLVEDIERLREHLDVERMILFGGSWGSTLALAYAETYPDRVAGMILRGIFTAAEDEIEYFYHGGVGLFFPEVYDGLLSRLEENEHARVHEALMEKITGADEERGRAYAEAWTRYELRISGLHVPDTAVDSILEELGEEAVFQFGLLENYYMANDCFLGGDRILKNAGRIGNIRTIIVNGRYDAICPPRNAYRLHRLLPDSELILVEKAGHWMGEPPVERELLEAVRRFE